MKYQANPVIVDAFVVTKVERDAEAHIVLTLENGKTVNMGCNPFLGTFVAGDYHVTIEGNQYGGPVEKHVFERKYSPVLA